MDIFEEATDAIIHSVDSQDRSQAQDPPTYGHWLGSGWGKDSWPHFLRQFYPHNPRPNNGNKRKNARTETVSAVRSRMQSPGWISSQSSTAVTLTQARYWLVIQEQGGLVTASSIFVAFACSYAHVKQEPINDLSTVEKLTNWLLCFWADGGFCLLQKSPQSVFYRLVPIHYCNIT